MGACAKCTKMNRIAQSNKRPAPQLPSCGRCMKVRVLCRSGVCSSSSALKRTQQKCHHGTSQLTIWVSAYARCGAVQCFDQQTIHTLFQCTKTHSQHGCESLSTGARGRTATDSSTKTMTFFHSAVRLSGVRGRGPNTLTTHISRTRNNTHTHFTAHGPHQTHY